MGKLLLPFAAAAMLLAAVMLAAAPGAVATPMPATAAACITATVGGHTTCLLAGRKCSPRYEQQYQRHGFKCRRNTAGEYRLWRVPLHSLPPEV